LKFQADAVDAEEAIENVEAQADAESCSDDDNDPEAIDP